MLFQVPGFTTTVQVWKVDLQVLIPQALLRRQKAKSLFVQYACSIGMTVRPDKFVGVGVEDSAAGGDLGLDQHQLGQFHKLPFGPIVRISFKAVLDFIEAGEAEGPHPFEDIDKALLLLDRVVGQQLLED